MWASHHRKEKHRAYMRIWRKTHPLTAEQRRKDNCRSIAAVYKRRGKLIPQPCETCGSGSVQMHHDNYDAPLKVRWFCRKCHIAHHAIVARETSEQEETEEAKP